MGNEGKKLDRRQVLRVLVGAGIGSITCLYVGKARADSVGALIPGKGWMKREGKCKGDGTPLQFIPKTLPDPDPLKDELKKYPRCPYCGMSRKMWNFSRHLVQYDDDLVDATCSLHCLALSLALNLDRGPKAIYAADFGSQKKIKPLINVDKAIYLVGSNLSGVMSTQSKRAFSSKQAAEAARKVHGGKLMSFDAALTTAYLDMAQDTVMIRKKRAAMRKMMKK